MPLFNTPTCPDAPDHGDMGGQVGGKRKLAGEASSFTESGDLEQAEVPPKRHCKEIYPDPEGDNGVVLEQGHVQFFSSLPSPTHPCQTDKEDIHGCMKDVAMPSRPTSDNPVSVQTSSVHHPPVSIQNQGRLESLWMNMDGETYCPLEEMDLHQGIMAMDTDCCPNPSQYQS